MKKLIILLFLGITSLPVVADDELYRYNDNMPMAEMMLDMMDTFGIVDKVRNRESLSTSNGLGVLSGNYLGNIELLQKLQQLQTLQGMGAMAPVNQPVIPPSTRDIFADAQDEKKSPYAAVPGFYSTGNDELSALVEAARHATQHGTGAAIQGAVNTSALDGMWSSQNRELLMISKGRFIWKDAAARQLSGYMKVVGTLLVATVPGHEKPMEFFYSISGNYMNVYDPTTGRTFSFFRTRTGNNRR